MVCETGSEYFGGIRASSLVEMIFAIFQYFSQAMIVAGLQTLFAFQEP